LLLAGFWDKQLGVLGALGSTGTFIIIPFMPAMNGNVPFLMKGVVLLGVSLYLLRQDLVRLPWHRIKQKRAGLCGFLRT
jgi:hypothetical protein